MVYLSKGGKLMVPTPEKVGVIATIGGMFAFWTGLIKIFLIFAAIGFGIALPLTIAACYYHDRRVKSAMKILEE